MGLLHVVIIGRMAVSPHSAIAKMVIFNYDEGILIFQLTKTFVFIKPLSVLKQLGSGSNVALPGVFLQNE